MIAVDSRSPAIPDDERRDPPSSEDLAIEAARSRRLELLVDVASTSPAELERAAALRSVNDKWSELLVVVALVDEEHRTAAERLGVERLHSPVDVLGLVVELVDLELELERKGGRHGRR